MYPIVGKCRIYGASACFQVLLQTIVITLIESKLKKQKNKTINAKKREYNESTLIAG